MGGGGGRWLGAWGRPRPRNGPGSSRFRFQPPVPLRRPLGVEEVCSITKFRFLSHRSAPETASSPPRHRLSLERPYLLITSRLKGRTSSLPLAGKAVSPHHLSLERPYLLITSRLRGRTSSSPLASQAVPPHHLLLHRPYLLITSCFTGRTSSSPLA